MRLWTLLSPLGSLAEGAPVGRDEPGVVRGAAPGAGRGRCAARPGPGRGRRPGGPPSASGRSSTCRSRPSLDGDAETLPLRLVDAWLAHPAVRAFLRVNAWEGAEYLHRESWDELLAWVGRLERVLTPREERARRPVEWSVLARRLTDAADAAGYRVDRLRAALGAKDGAGRDGRRRGARGGGARRRQAPCTVAAPPQGDPPAAGTGDHGRAAERRARRDDRGTATRDRQPDAPDVAASTTIARPIDAVYRRAHRRRADRSLVPGRRRGALDQPAAARGRVDAARDRHDAVAAAPRTTRW